MMETKVYNCNNPEENPVPEWLRNKFSARMGTLEAVQSDPVSEFKNNPDAFFPDFTSKN